MIFLVFLFFDMILYAKYRKTQFLEKKISKKSSIAFTKTQKIFFYVSKSY